MTLILSSALRLDKKIYNFIDITLTGDPPKGAKGALALTVPRPSPDSRNDNECTAAAWLPGLVTLCRGADSDSGDVTIT